MLVQSLEDTYKILKKKLILLGSGNTTPLYTTGAGVGAKDAFLLDHLVDITASTETTLITLKNTSTSKTLNLSTLTLLTEGNKPVEIKVYTNNINTATFEAWGDGSDAEIATNTVLTLTSSIIAGVTKVDNQVGSTLLAKEDKLRLNFDGDVYFSIKENETITITATSSNTSAVNIQIRWTEKV